MIKAKKMEAYTICQSCGMPLDRAKVYGSEKEGSKSCKYCRYCYQDGAFTKPDMTFDEMEHLARTKLQKMKTPKNVITQAVNGLPYLDRWIGKTVHA